MTAGAMIDQYLGSDLGRASKNWAQMKAWSSANARQLDAMEAAFEEARRHIEERTKGAP